MKTRTAGFTLIELLVAVAIVGILSAIALPAYNNYVIKGKRSQAKAVMLSLSQMEERYYTNNNAYYPVTTAAPNTEPQGWPNFAGTSMAARTYDISVTAASSTYTITATPSNGFTDNQCGTLTLDSTGAKTNNGTAGASPCW
jgi:type IV pilus assembly protein PilE